MPRLDDLELHDDDRIARLPRRRARLPRRLPVRIGDGLVPDRGRGAGGRARPVDLGHVQPHARQGLERRHRRRRRRPLPPARVRPRPDGRPRPRGLPVLDRVAAHPAHRPGTGERGGARVLRAARRRAHRPRHPTHRDPVPLGPAPGARGRGRLGESRHRRGVRRLRAHRGGAPRRPRRRVDDPQRALVQRVPRLRIGCARPRPHGRGEGARRRAPPEPRARPRDRRPPRGRRRTTPGTRSPSTCTSSAPSARPAPRRRGASTGSRTACSSGRSSTASTPPT